MSDTASRQTLTVSDGASISYLTAGDGPPLLLAHGFVSSAEGWWKIGAAQRLARTHRIIAPDLRGHGQSAKPDRPEGYGRHMMTDLVELLDAERVDDAEVAGFSMGAELSLALAVHHPERVRGLTLSGSGWSPPGIVEEYRKWHDHLAARWGNPEALAALIDGVPEFTGLPAEAVAALPMPIRGIIGELDDERPYMERIAGIRPGFAPVVLPGLNHLGTWRSPVYPDALVRAITAPK